MGKTLSREAEILKIFEEVEKEYGEGVVQLADDIPRQVIRIPSGNFATDVEMGGGTPIGRWGSIRSERESAGKTNWCIHQVRQYTDRGIYIIWVDGENVIEGNIQHYADAGVNLKYMILVFGEKAEVMAEVGLKFIKKGLVGALFLDSVQSLLIDVEDEKEFEEGQGNVGMKKANFMAGVTRKYIFHSRARLINTEKDNDTLKRNCITLFSIDRLNAKIKMTGFSKFTEYIATGGQHKENAYSWKLRITQAEWLKVSSGDTEISYAQATKFITEKNKTFSRRRKSRYNLHFRNYDGYTAGQIDNLESVVRLGLKYEVLNKLTKKDAGDKTKSEKGKKSGWVQYGKYKFNGKKNIIKLPKNIICDIMLDIIDKVNPDCIYFDEVDTVAGRKIFFNSYFPKCYNWNFIEEKSKKGRRKRLG